MMKKSFKFVVCDKAVKYFVGSRQGLHGRQGTEVRRGLQRFGARCSWLPCCSWAFLLYVLVSLLVECFLRRKFDMLFVLLVLF